MILIHTALLCEAIYLIEKLKLKKKTNDIFLSKDIIVAISKVGKKDTIKMVEYIYKNYDISKAINIGVAGTNSQDVNIGDIFCVNKQLDDMDFMPLITKDSIVLQEQIVNPTATLYDMEGGYFYNISSRYLVDDDIYIFKIVSDFLDKKKLDKDFVKNLIKQNYQTIKNYF
ncbi:MAG: hypothetical protein B1H07_01730 [Campylobacteraceae bacterium 4484_166]|nr:MAG: hypothetical protein B1H07_01730 [Campylobacteraceae bacterium 4484_166]